MVYKKGYQEFENVEIAVVTKVKGVAFTNTNPNIPDIYKRIWDTSDLIVPPSENDAFFITTNIIITPNQTRGACSEVLITLLKILFYYCLSFLHKPSQDPDVYGALCGSSHKCIKGQSLPIGNGAMTGRCIPSDVNSSINVCEVFAWCPIEQDIFPLYDNP